MNKLPPNSSSNKSIAVLPFVNMSPDTENEYFSDGITEEIINALTTVKGLKVIARTSSFAFKNKNIDVRTIGDQLGVNTVLEGSVRKVKNKVRITAQLISTNDGTHLWSKNFDRDLENIFALQDEVSLLIADQIRENFGHLEIPSFPLSIPTKNIDAFDLVLKGNYYLKRNDFDDINRAVNHFKQAIQIDPNYAEAYAALGESYLHVAGYGLMSIKEAYELARQAGEKAVGLNEENAQGYKVLAMVKFFYEWDWNAALEKYDKAIKCGLPNQNDFNIYYCIFIQEDFERAIQLTHKVIETNPLDAHTHWQLGLTLYFSRRFEKSVAAFSSALELDPNFGEALRFRGLVKGYLGKFKEAMIDINRALELTSGQGLANLDKIVVKILMGKKKGVSEAIKNENYKDSSDPAFIFSLLNMPDEAIFWLEKAFQERSVMMVTLKNFWVWDNIRDDPRFQEMYDKMNFPPSIKNKYDLTPIQIFQSDQANTSLLNDNEVEKYLQQLEQLIHEDKMYTDSSLSLRQMAEKMGLHSNKLSWLLNEHVKKNFNEYINAYRLETFKEKSLDPKNQHLTLLGLAYESGFNSKTAFNAFFKKMEGMTPRAWVKKNIQ